MADWAGCLGGALEES